jgi:hypothetical protein
MVYKNNYQDSSSKAISTINSKRMEAKSFRYWTTVFLLTLISLLATGCDTPTKPSTDLSSPESTIKSYWAIKQYEMKERMETRADSRILDLYDEQARKTEEAQVDALIHIWRKPLPNTIESISLETPTRAIVYTSEAYTHAEDPKRERHKYILTNVGGEWYIENAFRECGICHGTGKIDDYSVERQSDGTRKQKVCEYCKGRGLTSEIYEQ